MFTKKIGALLVLVASCSSDRSLHLSTDGHDQAANARALRMNVKVTVDDDLEDMGVRSLTREYALYDCFRILQEKPGTSLFTDGDSNGCNPDAMVTAEAEGQGAPPSAPQFIEPNSCGKALCRSLAAVCVANRLLELASAAGPVTFTRPGSPDVVVIVPPQDEESNAWYAEEAWHYAAWATTVAGDNLRNAAGRSGTTGSCTAMNMSSTLDGTTYGEHFAAMLADSAHLSEEAVQQALRHYQSVADADFAREPDIGTAAGFAWVDGRMSRARAAHLATGGALDSGLAEFSEGICPIPPLDDEGKEALDVLRLTGPSLEDATDLEIDFPTLYTDVLVDRLIERTGDDSYDTLDPDEFLAQRGLTKGDFLAARTYLGHEAKAFARDTTGRALPAFPRASSRNNDGTTDHEETALPYYAATATPPSPPPAAYFRTLTRFAGLTDGITHPSQITAAKDGVPLLTPPPENADLGVVPSAAYAREGLGPLLDYVATVASDVTTTPGSLTPELAELVAEVASTQRLRSQGRLETCYRYFDTGAGNKDELRFRIYGSSDEDNFEVVSGVSGLRCAVTGTVEGAPCNLGQYAYGLETSRTNSTNPDAQYGYSKYVELKFQGITYDQPGPWLYIVHKDEASPAEPGFYQPVGGLRLILASHASASDDWRYCSLFPMNPDLDHLVETALSPNPEFCGRPETSCAGPQFTQRIPLENELSSDGDDRESSWKVYLARAQEAADRADALGEQLIQAGLEMDVRTEAAEEELESLCGGAISLAGYFPDPTDNPARGPSCDAVDEGEPCMTDGSICQNGRCVTQAMSLIEAKADSDPTAQKLSECLGDQGVYDYVTLGSRHLCVWVDDSGQICSGGAPPGGSPECPYLPDDDDSCDTLPAGAPMGVEAKSVDTMLKLFSPPNQRGANADDLPSCSSLRSLRNPETAGIFRALAIQAIDGTFNLEKIRALAARIGWEPRPRDYSAITLDGVELWSTGNPQVSPPESSAWPCGGEYENRENAARVPCTTHTEFNELADSLFCSYTEDCTQETGSTVTDRARMNQRMARAVLAARILTGVGVGPSFVAPTEATTDDFTKNGCTWEENDITWDDKEVETFYPGARTGKRGTTLSYDYDSSGPNIWCDLSDDDVAVVGSVFCISDANDVLWTDFPGALDSTSDQKHASCSSTWIPMFRTCEESLDGTDPLMAAKIWHGLDEAEDGAESHEQFNGLALGLLRQPQAPDALWIRPVSDGVSATVWGGPVHNKSAVEKLTTYWRDDAIVRNSIGIARDGLRVGDILDAMELLCEVERLDRGFTAGCSETPPVGGTPLQALAASGQFLECKGNDFLRLAERQVLANVPRSAIDGLNSAYQFHGERGAEAGELAAAIIGMGGHQRTVSLELKGLASDITRLKMGLTANANDLALAQLQALATQYNQMAACAATAFDVFKVVDPLQAVGVVGGTWVTCSNAKEQINIALDSRDLTQANLQIQGELNWEDYRMKLHAHTNAIADALEQMQEQATLMRSSLARMEAQRRQGERNLAKALMLGTDAEGTQYEVNTSMRRRYNTLQIRYDRARSDALKMAWLARRAIEQRLGFHLEDLRDDLALVEAPARWADALCTSSGIDYTRIRNETALDVDDYADEYIGDYVRKLDRVMQSYEHDFPFTDSEDVAVISLRDDVTGTRATCPTSVNNLLAYSARLLASGDAEDAGEVTTVSGVTSGAPPDPVWELVDCDLVDGVADDCISRTPIDSDAPEDMPIPEATFDNGDVKGYRITFAPGDGTSFQNNPPSTPVSAVAQTVPLLPGYYRLSWYGRKVSDSIHEEPLVAVVIRSESGEADVVDQTSVGTIDELGRPSAPATVWKRYYFVFQVPFVSLGPTNYQVAIVPQSNITDTTHSVDIAGIMLEDLSGYILGQPDVTELTAAEYAPADYVATSEAGIGPSGDCEDTDGEVFQTKWRQGCVKLCPSGFGTCDEGEDHCYWELPLSVTLDGIERGGLLRQSGFAYGNYNYRIDSVAVNLVGTGLRDCSLSPTPSTCYAAGNIPYSIIHEPPFEVRNHRGDVYDAPLYTGHIEHGRGLTAERYISNPISSADRALLTDYWHTELRGRPLTGRYTLRIWNADGVTIDHLEDVQIVLDYRYWTRFQ